jgi:hypothetical protein
MGAHQLLVYADDVNLLGDNIDTIKKRTETLIDTNEEVDTEKTEYILLSCHQNGWENNDIKIGNRCFESVTQFIYLGMTSLNLVRRKLIRVMLVTIQSRTSCLLICCLKTQKSDHMKL